MKKKERKFYQTRDFRKLQQEWYEKLGDTGFDDIEGGGEGHLLRGPTSTVSLSALANRGGVDQGLRDRTKRVRRRFDDIADSENELFDFHGGNKARYFHMAGLVASQQVARSRLPAEVLYTMILHARGMGSRAIAEILEQKRSKIRSNLEKIRDIILLALDSEHR